MLAMRLANSIALLSGSYLQASANNFMMHSTSLCLTVSITSSISCVWLGEADTNFDWRARFRQVCSKLPFSVLVEVRGTSSGRAMGRGLGTVGG
jgi:hypothetical protein